MSIVAAYVLAHPPLIVPEVGHGQQERIAKTTKAFEEVARRIARLRPQTIVVASPHAPLYRDCFQVSTGDVAQGTMGQFGAWDASLTLPYDTRFAQTVMACARKHDVALCGSGMQDTQLDHATFVPLYFVMKAYANFELVRVGLSGLSPEKHRSMGRCIAEAASDLNRRCVFIASGDLSHKLSEDGPYGFAPEGPVFDREVTAFMESGNLNGFFTFSEPFLHRAAECGLGSFQIMAGALEGYGFNHELLSYEGPFGVGYAVAAFQVQGQDNDPVNDGQDFAQQETEATSDERSDALVALARAAVEHYVATGHALKRPQNLSADLLDERAGVFVSLYEHGDLRGCIGTIEPTTNSIADEILRNAQASASEDPRFAPVCEDELDYLSYSVDVLFEPQDIQSKDELDPDRYGVIVHKGMRRGLLLPHLEGVETVEQQLSIVLSKAGIAPEEGRVGLQRFEVVRHTQGGEARCE